jgi:hypothetical protein
MTPDAKSMSVWDSVGSDRESKGGKIMRGKKVLYDRRFYNYFIAGISRQPLKICGRGNRADA